MNEFVTIPTYNESENIAKLIAAIRGIAPNIGIVVADDDSPDQTWKIVEEIARSDPRVFLLRRMEKKGRGWAGADAFRFALERGAEVVVEMDADFSHDPRYIPAFLQKIDWFDVVLGSRAVSGGQDMRPSALRKWITGISSLYARMVLGVPVRDCNSGFRCFRRRVLEAIDMGTVLSSGPSIVQELLYRAHLLGFSIVEIPIAFPERAAGQSNLNFRKLLQGFFMVLKLRWMHLSGKI
jgi:dolichol-phosphate mannosyltransferase